MRVLRTIDIDAPADEVWQLVGPEYGDVAAWAHLVKTSSRTPSGDGRQCAVTGVPGVSRLVERLTSYDDADRSLSYVVDDGMPSFVRESGNTWTVEPTGPRSSRVSATASISLTPWAALLAPVMRLAVAHVETRTLADLKAAAERRVNEPGRQ